MADWFGVSINEDVVPDHRGEGTEQKERVMTERMRWQTEAAEMSVLCRLSDRVRSPEYSYSSLMLERAS